MTLYQYPNYLCHYGVKGMKWGIRRYQNEDGTLTAIGKKREAWLNAKKSGEQNSTVKYLKREYKDSKILDKVNSKKKSKHQEKLEQKYIDQGYSKKDAAVQAYKRVRTERALAAAGAMTLAAVAAYGANKKKQKELDTFIDPDSVLGRVTTDSNKGVKDAFYAYENKNTKDKNRYQGLYGAQTSLGGMKSVYVKNMKVSGSGIKVASHNNAKKAMSDLINEDSQYKKYIENMLEQDSKQTPLSNPKHTKLAKKALSDFKQGKMTDSVYEAFNVNLYRHDSVSEKNNSKFYKKLSEYGYQAIQDVNDKKYSGYNSKNPLIIFDKSSVVVDSVRKMSSTEVANKYVSESYKLLTEQLVKKSSPYIAGYAAYRAVKKSDSSKIKKYRKEHPNTNLSNNEILKLYDDKK